MIVARERRFENERLVAEKGQSQRCKHGCKAREPSAKFERGIVSKQPEERSCGPEPDNGTRKDW